MNPLHWTWLAATADWGLLMTPLVLSNAQLAFWQLIAAHAVISVVAAAATYLLLPAKYHRPRWAVWGLLFCFAFMAPVLGAVGLVLVTRINLRHARQEAQFATPIALGLPVYDVQSGEQRRGGQGAIRSRLGPKVPSTLRMQSLLTLQAVPSRVSNPILEELLGDETDDVRLVAFGMLDAEEKKISNQIRQIADRLTQSDGPEQRYDSLRQLAELHWELVYACLAQGELRKHMLHQAATFADEALGLQPDNGSGLLFLRARIWLEQGDTEAAEQAFLGAIRQGQALSSALPYLAEIAFMRRDFSLVRDNMQQLSNLNLSARTRAIQDFWCNSQEIKYSDRKFLQHI